MLVWKPFNRRKPAAQSWQKGVFQSLHDCPEMVQRGSRSSAAARQAYHCASAADAEATLDLARWLLCPLLASGHRRGGACRRHHRRPECHWTVDTALPAALSGAFPSQRAQAQTASGSSSGTSASASDWKRTAKTENLGNLSCQLSFRFNGSAPVLQSPSYCVRSKT